jgi:hypothetical protein
MHRRCLVVASLAAAVLLSGCSSETPKDRERDARHAVESYVSALNSRDEGKLIAVGGVPDDSRARREAREILAAKGGQELSITNVKIDFDMGDSAGSAKIIAKSNSGKTMHDSFSVVKEDGEWHLSIFADRPAPSGKSTSSV